MSWKIKIHLAVGIMKKQWPTDHCLENVPRRVLLPFSDYFTASFLVSLTQLQSAIFVNKQHDCLIRYLLKYSHFSQFDVEMHIQHIFGC